ncbi:MAG: porin family protein [Tannerella sp.]|jgi:hypothetical protein|nr:porin family protein [Tannerella sp.]
MTGKGLLKIICVCLFCAGLSVTASAQSAFAKNDKVINLGIGLPTYLGGNGYSMSMPLISGSFEYGIVDNLINGKASIGVGGYLAYTANKYEYMPNYGHRYSYFILGPRGAFHYSPVPKLDTYGGLMLGYDIIGSSTYGAALPYDQDKYTVSGSKIGYSIFAGVRYYFTSHIAVFGEVGYGIAPLEGGISFRF